jgi:hypothetical protein
MGSQAFYLSEKLDIISHFSQISLCECNDTATPEKMIDG